MGVHVGLLALAASSWAARLCCFSCLWIRGVWPFCFIWFVAFLCAPLLICVRTKCVTKAIISCGVALRKNANVLRLKAHEWQHIFFSCAWVINVPHRCCFFQFFQLRVATRTIPNAGGLQFGLCQLRAGCNWDFFPVTHGLQLDFFQLCADHN
jgi:hypothetical protein